MARAIAAQKARHAVMAEITMALPWLALIDAVFQVVGTARVLAGGRPPPASTGAKRPTDRASIATVEWNPDRRRATLELCHNALRKR